jgi:hypothetical protein
LEPRDALGRNLTYGLLDNLGRRIVTGSYDRNAALFPESVRCRCARVASGTEISIDPLLQFTDLRAAIEPAEADLAATHANPAAISLIATGFERMRESLRVLMTCGSARMH